MVISMHLSASAEAEAVCTSDSSPVATKRPLSATDNTVEAENRRKDPKISRACDICKRKKIRCNGTLPCGNCAKRKIDCAYDARYGRGRPPTPPCSIPTQVQETGISRIPVVSNPANRVDAASVPLAREPSRDPPNESSFQNLQETEAEDQYFDPTSGLNFLHRAWKKLSTQKGEGLSTDLNETYGRQLLTSAGDRPFNANANIFDASSSTYLPQESTAWKLLEFYFEACVVTYRMLHRPTIEAWMKVLVENRRNDQPIGHSLGHTRSAILLVIIAIANLRYEKTHGDMSTESEFNALDQSDRLFCMATNLTDAETGFPRLESVQARLLQVLYLLQTSRMNKGWYTFGQTCNITLSLGMHRRRDYQRDVSFSSRRLGYIPQQCYKRTFWVAYTIDKYLSVVFGRPRLYQDEDIDQEYPESVNDEDMTSEGSSLSEDPGDNHIESLIFHAKIARILGKISRKVYCVGEISNDDRLVSAQLMIQELHEWRASLPAHLGTVKPSTLVPIFRRQAVALQLAYSHAIMHATRPFLLGNGNTATSMECISAAKASLQLVDKMAGDKNLFHSFWWTHYVTFCALAVVYAWGIQLVRRPAGQDDDELYSKLFDLAEKCRSHLRQATAGLSPNRRYDIILEELRKEARNCHDNTGQTTNFNRGLYRASSESEDMAASAVHDLQFSNVSHNTGSYDPTNNYLGIAENGSGPSAFGFEGTFQFSDWLTLDSSAFFPVSDPNSVSPPWLSALP